MQQIKQCVYIIFKKQVSKFNYNFIMDEQKDDIQFLIEKISRLRTKLISFGYNSKETKDIILNYFLNISNVLDWYDMQNINMYYFLKQKLNQDIIDFQLMVCLVKFFYCKDKKNFGAAHLLQRIEQNSLCFGINLMNSSSDSDESQQCKIGQMRNYQNNKAKVQFSQNLSKRSLKPLFEECNIRKKIHMEEVKRGFKRQLEQKQYVEYEKLEKKLKKMQFDQIPSSKKV